MEPEIKVRCRFKSGASVQFTKKGRRVEMRDFADAVAAQVPDGAEKTEILDRLNAPAAPPVERKTK